MDSLVTYPQRVEESNLTLADFETAKRKLLAENGDLLRQIEEAESSNVAAQKVKDCTYPRQLRKLIFLGRSLDEGDAASAAG